MIKNIVFDVGNVLVHFRWYDYMLDLGISAGTADFLGKNMVMTKFWDEMDLGAVDEDKACEYFQQLYPQYEREIGLFWKDMTEIVRPFEHAVPLISRLKEKGYKVYLLSNYPPKLSALHWPKFEFRKLTDGEIISGLEKLAKPDPGIFELLTKRYGLNKEECLFIDDRQANVDAAVSFGMSGAVFDGTVKRSSEEVIEIFEKLLRKMQ